MDMIMPYPVAPPCPLAHTRMPLNTIVSKTNNDMQSNEIGEHRAQRAELESSQQARAV
jgi:hypothetical protein